MARRTPSPGASSPVPTADGTDEDRATRLRRRYVERRQAHRISSADSFSSVEPLLDVLVDLALGDFADWIALDLFDEAGATVRARLGHSFDVDETAATALEQAAPGLAGAVDRVLSGGSTETWPEDDDSPRAVVVGLRVKDRPFGAVSFVLETGREGYRDVDVAVAEEVAWGVGSMIERTVLHLDNRQALRATQRMARQLHQLFAATVTISSLRLEREIAAAVVQSARRIFDADAASIVIDEPFTVAGIRRGQVHAAPTLDGVGESPACDDDGCRIAGEWLVAPVEERHSRRHGVLAMRRSTPPFVAEDREIATLLAQAAASALGATALARGIERSEARLRALVVTAPIGIIEVNLDRSIRWWNRSAERIFGWPSPGDGPAPTPPRGLADALSDLWDEVRSGASGLRDLVDVEVRGRPRDLTVAAALVDLPDEPQPTLMALVDDVTDHRQLKAEVAHAQQMETRGRVASSVAHDFNNLLTLISGYAEILSRELDDDRMSEMVHEIQSTTSRASMLTAQLQSIGRTQALEPIVLVPADVVRANAEVLERIVGPEVDIEFLLDDDAGAIVVDAAQFEQTILNLAINARDSMPDGGRLRIGVDGVHVDEERASGLAIEPGDYILVTVTDTGVGMDADTQARCFDAFFTTKGPFKGTGLGLASARRLVEASGGAIAVRSTLGVGTTFEVLFPVTREAVVVELASAAPRRARGFATVLVAEDDEGLRRLMQQVLTRNGYLVLATESGEEARTRFDAYDGPIDLLVSDVVLGGISGPELAADLQSRHPRLMVLLTSGTADESVISTLAPGTSAFLAKPFRPSALIDGVHDLLAHRD